MICKNYIPGVVTGDIFFGNNKEGRRHSPKGGCHPECSECEQAKSKELPMKAIIKTVFYTEILLRRFFTAFQNDSAPTD